MNNQPLEYSYNSTFSPYIIGLIEERRANGFSYKLEAYGLKKFDNFCVNHGINDSVITEELALDWSVQTRTERLNYRNQRISFLRQLAKYMISLGLDAYVPEFRTSTYQAIPHLLNQAELTELFSTIDLYSPRPLHERNRRLHIEYQVLFRLFYCLGLRLSEGCNILVSDVNTIDGTIIIRQSKGRKDRIVYPSWDLNSLLKEYLNVLRVLGVSSLYLFPGGNYPKIDKPFSKTTIDKKFNQFWMMTSASRKCEKHPTVHALRHTFVVNKMNEWMNDDKELDYLLPYLVRYLGHSDIPDTLYYYHQVSEAFQIIRKKDSQIGTIIPEVKKIDETD